MFYNCGFLLPSVSGSNTSGGGTFRKELYPKPKFNMLCALSQNYQHFVEKCMLWKQIVRENQKLHYCGKPNNFWAILLNNICCTFWPITQEALGVLKFWCHFLSFSDNWFQDASPLLLVVNDNTFFLFFHFYFPVLTSDGVKKKKNIQTWSTRPQISTNSISCTYNNAL